MIQLYARTALPWAALGFVMLVPWLAALERERSITAAIVSGTAMAMAFTVVVFAWFATAVARYTDTSSLVVHGLLILAAPLLQPQIVAFAAVRHALRSRGQPAVVTSVAAASAWVGAEWLCPRLLGDTIGHGLHPFATLRQGADVAGAAGLTLVIVLVNQSVYVAIRSWRLSTRTGLAAVGAATLLVGLLAGYGAIRLRQVTRAEPTGAPLTAALVQASLGDYDALRVRVGSFKAVRTILDAHERLSRAALDRNTVDLLVWPETVYPTTFGSPKSPEGAGFDAEIVRFAARTGVPLLFGTYDRQGGHEYNAAVLIERGRPPDVYRKRRPFPLTETVPSWLDSAFLRRHLPWLGSWHAGDGPPVLTLHRAEGDLVLAPLICLDAVDPRLAIEAARRGAELLVTISNDGWFADGAGARLHLVVSSFRSIETRLPQLRATNGGISAVISPTGEIVARTEVGRTTALVGQVRPGRRRGTFITRWGDRLGPITCLIALLLLASTRGRRRAP